MKRLILVLLVLCLLSGCAPASQTPTQKQYTATFLSLFDTVTTIVGKAESEAAFQTLVQPVHDMLEHYHQLFDIYHDYEGMHNLKTLNDKAASSPIVVDTILLDLLEDCKRYYTATNGNFNPAMGSVLRLWHTAREDGINDPANAYLPNADALREAAKHTHPDDIVIDRAQSTVFFRDPQLKLDVGGIAKGWAVERVCKTAPTGLLLSVGGNVYATGPKDSDGTPWVVGIKNPSGESDYLHTLNITGGSVVTSGSYHRSYVVNGKLYHHIIDPRTLYPSELWTSVTVVCADSRLADVLSTALFLLNQTDGEALLAQFHAHAMWVDTNGKQYYSSSFADFIRA